DLAAPGHVEALAQDVQDQVEARSQVPDRIDDVVEVQVHGRSVGHTDASAADGLDQHADVPVEAYGRALELELTIAERGIGIVDRRLRREEGTHDAHSTADRKPVRDPVGDDRIEAERDDRLLLDYVPSRPRIAV